MKLRVLPFLFLAVVAAAPAPGVDNHADERTGAVLYRDNCARCHGVNLEGGKKVPALAEIRTKKRWTDERITKQILNGEGKMPPFRDSLSAEQIRQLIAFLRAADRPVPPPAP